MDPAILVIAFFIGLVVGAICAAVANSKGRSSVGWFFIGLGAGFLGGVCLGWIPILIVSVLPNLHEERERDAHFERENRRLRERLYQEQMKSETFRQHAMARLDAHDTHSGIDTRGVQGLPGQAQGPAQIGANPNLAADPNTIPLADDPPGFRTFPGTAGDVGTASSAIAQPERMWHYEHSGEAVGPVAESQLADLLRYGHIAHTSLVWHEGMPDWGPANENHALQRYLS